MSRQLPLVLLASVCAFLALLWLAQRGVDAGVEHGIPSEGPAGQSKASESGGKDPDTRFARAREPETSGPGTLQLRISRDDGLPARGSVYWIHSAEPPTTSNLLLAQRPAGRDQPRIHELAHEGSASVDVPAGSWTWLRVTCVGRQGLSAFARFGPFSGRRQHDITLSGSRRGIHVFLLESDMATPAAGQVVRLFERDMRGSRPPALLRSEKTDANGYLTFRSLAPGAFLLCAPGAAPGDPVPHCLALVMPPGMPGPEQACTLVVAEARMGIRLKVSAVFEKGRGPGPRLFLRSWDDPRRPVYPVPGQLRVGDQELTVQVPVGDYGAAVLPLGRFKVFPEEQILRARPGRESAFEIQVVAKTRRTEVKLLGLSSRDLPVTVSPRPTGELLTGAQQMLFCGPYRWPTATQRIHAPSGPVILVVFSRKKSWISDRVVNFTRNEESVRLLRASRVFVRWYSNRPLQGEEAIVTVQSRLGDEEVLLKPALLQLAGLTRRVLSGSVVVPQGRVKLDCTLGRSGARAWVRVITAKGPVVGVTIDK